MEKWIRVLLNTTPEQYGRLCELRTVFAQACNELAPHVQQSRVWNRVALHHLHYRSLRERFPELGSQMVCNVIYAVSKIARLVYQDPASPYSIARRSEQRLPLPLLKFAESCPVYFDRHTLTIKPNQLSLYTMDGRMHFELAMDEMKLDFFRSSKLREVLLKEHSDRVFELLFCLDEKEARQQRSSPLSTSAQLSNLPMFMPQGAIPSYVSVEDVS